MGYEKNRSDCAYPSLAWFEDFKLGQRFGYGAWRLQRQEMQDFANLYDPEAFHLDDQAARQAGWDAMIASGLQLACIWRRLSKEAFPNARILVSPGWDELRWFRPVYAGDLLQAHSEVVEARLLSSRPNQGLVRLSNELRRGDEVISSFIANWFLARRPETRAAPANA